MAIENKASNAAYLETRLIQEKLGTERKAQAQKLSDLLFMDHQIDYPTVSGIVDHYNSYFISHVMPYPQATNEKEIFHFQIFETGRVRIGKEKSNKNKPTLTPLNDLWKREFDNTNSEDQAALMSLIRDMQDVIIDGEAYSEGILLPENDLHDSIHDKSNRLKYLSVAYSKYPDEMRGARLLLSKNNNEKEAIEIISNAGIITPSKLKTLELRFRGRIDLSGLRIIKDSEIIYAHV